MSFYSMDLTKYPQSTMELHCRSFCFDAKALPPKTKKAAFHHHNHEALEILMLKEGSVSITVEDRTYLLSPGDVVLVNPFLIHCGEWIPNGGYNEYICFTLNLSRWMSFKESILFQALQQLLEEQCCFDEFYPVSRDLALFRCLCEIEKAFWGKDEKSECVMAAEAYRLLALLFDGHYGANPSPGVKKRNIAFMQNVAGYLKQHYAEDISTADIANALYMSVSQFCRTFKRHFSMSFLNYLCQYRVVRATELYSESAVPLAQIAAAVGFPDYCYFSRSFKKYIGQSPAVYFGKWKPNPKA